MKKHTIFLIIVFISSVLIGQNEKSKEIIKEAYSKYFELPRESAYLHLNKSTYIVNENIWFKGYIYNQQTEKPFVETSNVYVGIYDSIGKEVTKRLYRAKNGFFNGNIEVDSTFSSGHYYVKTATNWMKNFKEDGSFVQKIKILHKKDIKTLSNTLKYDIQFLPEGGNLILNTPNVMGVKISDQHGYGVEISNGVVFDNEDAQVAQFKVSKFGLGKFNFTPRLNMNYRAIITLLNGNEKIINLPKARDNGINISLKNVDNERIILTLTTNAETRDGLDDKIFYLLIHRDGLAKRIEISFPNNAQFVSRIIEKKLLHNGMNIITLIDDAGVPILERLFFNTYSFTSGKVSISKLKTENDSLTIQVKVYNQENKNQNLSISVLPKSTISYSHKDNILSAFYLKPYIRGFIESPSYYFKDINKKKEAELDLLLLTQGWSKYDWKSVLKSPPNQFFKFEQGLSITGVINTKTTPLDKILIGFRDNTSQILDIKNNRFDFSNYYAVKGEQINFSLSMNNKKRAKLNIKLSLNISNIPDKVSMPWHGKIEVANNWETKILSVPSLNLSDDTIQLDEVTVFEKKKKNILAEKNVFIPRYLKGKVTEVTDDIEFSFPFFSDIIRSRGYYVREELTWGSTDRVIIRAKTVQSFSSVRSLPVPAIYLNDVRLTTFDLLYRMPTNEVENFQIDKTGGGEGTRGAGGVIRIYTRRGGAKVKSGTGKGVSDQILKYTFLEGFESIKNFYTPQYSLYSNDAFENFGVIHWIPELIINENGIGSFKIPNTSLENISFFIEGMGFDGTLISVIENLEDL